MTTCEHCAKRFPDDLMPALICPACIAFSRPTTSIILSPTSEMTYYSVLNKGISPPPQSFYLPHLK